MPSPQVLLLRVLCALVPPSMPSNETLGLCCRNFDVAIIYIVFAWARDRKRGDGGVQLVARTKLEDRQRSGLVSYVS